MLWLFGSVRSTRSLVLSAGLRDKSRTAKIFACRSMIIGYLPSGEAAIAFGRPSAGDSYFAFLFQCSKTLDF